MHAQSMSDFKGACTEKQIVTEIMYAQSIMSEIKGACTETQIVAKTRAFN